ncbi:MAG: 16S rRNA (adenine(1518)-N(6)/adenine(1519)-N(6))-dimethyltransferase RsmA [Prevotella sp.]|nr:16S rRNA (adenine(1518)-N(6)/adenine(1519)-N(6))-dimethyltransferase RsmA [Staphylococcus sp.]MCM1350907.1 16S rRNA (adenine(1518)-N(6)/adenine(1519)-N(6))-dimethyltransferase RsmA [Prevotella sp.]
MTKEKVKQILNQENIVVKKQYGQNFLLDENVLEKIVDAAEITNDINVVEIGPGLGFLTERLQCKANQVLCYEIDSQMVEHLQTKSFSNVKIIQDDILNRVLNEDFSMYFDNKPIYVVANLPYYITTPILIKILEETRLVSKMIVMMQTEVAKRLCGKPSTKDYNSLSVLIQYFTKAELLFPVYPHSFYPEPGVESSVVSLEYKEIPENKADDLNYFLKFNRAIFAQRRKTLMNNIVKAYPYPKEKILELLMQLGIHENIRSEALSVSTIVELANLFYHTFEQNK